MALADHFAGGRDKKSKTLLGQLPPQPLWPSSVENLTKLTFSICRFRSPALQFLPRCTNEQRCGVAARRGFYPHTAARQAPREDRRSMFGPESKGSGTAGTRSVESVSTTVERPRWPSYASSTHAAGLEGQDSGVLHACVWAGQPEPRAWRYRSQCCLSSRPLSEDGEILCASRGCHFWHSGATKDWRVSPEAERRRARRYVH